MSFISTNKDTNDLSITIYNNGFAVVTEKRSVNIPETEDNIRYIDVAQNIETDSIIVKGLEILELNYDYDLVNMNTLLQKYIDKNIFIYSSKDNKKEEYRLLSTVGGMIVEKIDTKEIVINPEGQVILPKLPEGLLVKPSLVWKISNFRTDEIKVSYITRGFDWTSNYVITLKEDCFDLEGWVNIQNNSGAEFANAKLKLMAGDVRRNICHERNDVVYSSLPVLESNFSEKSFLDYHMYTLERNTTLKNNQSKQIGFINKESISYKKYYAYHGNSQNPNIILQFKNKIEDGLGIPLPKGTIKVYSENKEDSNLEFIGENNINHTPKDDIIKLNIGNAFDIKCCGQMIYKRRVDNRYMSVKYRYIIDNHKDEEAIVRLYYDFPDTVEEMLESSDELAPDQTCAATFCVNVMPNEKREVWFVYTYNDIIPIEVIKEKVPVKIVNDNVKDNKKNKKRK